MKFTANMYKVLFMLCLCALLMPACTDDFEDLNTNPNEPELVPPATIFPYAIREGIDRIHGHRTRLERLGLDGGDALGTVFRS